MRVASVSPEHGVGVNLAITALICLFLTTIGGVWGITAVYCYFAFGVMLRGQGEGLVGAAFLPLFMSPWAAMAGWTIMRMADAWIGVISPGRERSSAG